MQPIAHPIMASGKTQGTGCALVSHLKVPEALLSFHQANMGWPASSWIFAPGVAKRRGSGGGQPRELSLDSQAHLELSAGLAWALLSWKSHCCPSGRRLQLGTLDPLSCAGQAWVCFSLRGTCCLPPKVQSWVPEALQTCSGAGRARTNLDLGRPLAVLGAGPGPPLSRQRLQSSASALGWTCLECAGQRLPDSGALETILPYYLSSLQVLLCASS